MIKSPRGIVIFALGTLLGVGCHAAATRLAEKDAAKKIFKTTDYQYHHMGIPINEVKPGELYSSRYDMYSTGGSDSEFRIEWHRFGPKSTLPEIVKHVPHVGFKVDNIEKAIEGRKVIFGPYDPFPNFRVAMIELNGGLVEFIQTTMSDEEVWYGSKENTYLYPSK